jgi:hypothetical protein
MALYVGLDVSLRMTSICTWKRMARRYGRAKPKASRRAANANADAEEFRFLVGCATNR